MESTKEVPMAARDDDQRRRRDLEQKDSIFSRSHAKKTQKLELSFDELP